MRSYLFGVLLIGVVVVCWVGSSVITKSIFQDQAFDNPLFLTYFSMDVFVSNIPVYYAVKYMKNLQEAGSGVRYQQTMEESLTPNHKPEQSVLYSTFLNSLLFAPVWFLMTFTFNYSLLLTSVSSNTILSTTSALFTMLFGAIIAKKMPSLYKMLGVALSIFGAVVISLPDIRASKDTSAWQGDLLAVVSASLYGAYSILLERRSSISKSLPMSLLYGIIGLESLLVLSPIVLIMWKMQLMNLSQLTTSVFLSLLLNGLVSTVSDVFWARSVVLTSPLIATVGLSLTIPVAILADLIFSGRSFPLEYALGSIFAFVGFVLVQL